MLHHWLPGSGNINFRLAFPTRHEHIIQKVRIDRQRTLYISVHDDDHPAEIFLRVKVSDCSTELIARG